MIPDFEYDIFISYAHVDNLTPTGKKNGWVNFFHKYLEFYLARKSGRYGQITIWRDKNLDGTQLFDDVISQKIRSSALFVALASKAYYESNYCRSELKDFFSTAKGNPELLKVGDRCRIVHVLLQNIPHTDWLPAFGRTPAFIFHDADRDADAWAGYANKIDSEAFDNEIKKLADAIYKTLETLQKIGGRPPTQPEQAFEVVEPASVVDESNVGEFELYFADVGDTLQKLRRRVVSRIKESDKQVKVGSFLPPPYDLTKHNAKVLERLKRARLSVHLFNEYPGKDMEDEGALSYPQKQAELARDKAQSQLVVWVPKDIDFEQIDAEYADYKNFLKNLERLAEEEKSRGSTDAAQTTHDFIHGVHGEPADLAESILKKVDALRRRDETTRPDVDGILVDTHSKDAIYATQIGGFLSKRGMRVHVVPHSGEGEDAKMLYEETLKQVRSVLIVFGGVAESWAVGRFWAAMKAIINEACSIDNIFVFLAPPEKDVSPDVFLKSKPVKPPSFIHHMDSDTLAPDKLKLLL
jgi:hypothetical protein